MAQETLAGLPASVLSYLALAKSAVMKHRLEAAARPTPTRLKLRESMMRR
jgi:hypothetical protein